MDLKDKINCYTGCLRQCVNSGTELLGGSDVHIILFLGKRKYRNNEVELNCSGFSV